MSGFRVPAYVRARTHVFLMVHGNCCMTQGCLQPSQAFCVTPPWPPLRTALCFPHGSPAPCPLRVPSNLQSTGSYSFCRLGTTERQSSHGRSMCFGLSGRHLHCQNGPWPPWPQTFYTPPYPTPGQWMALSCGPGLSSLWIENELIC